MDIVHGQAGPEAVYDIAISGGLLTLGVQYKGAQANASAAVGINVDLFLDELAKKIPGQLDDAIIAMLKSVLNSL